MDLAYDALQELAVLHMNAEAEIAQAGKEEDVSWLDERVRRPRIV